MKIDLKLQQMAGMLRSAYDEVERKMVHLDEEKFLGIIDEIRNIPNHDITVIPYEESVLYRVFFNHNFKHKVVLDIVRENTGRIILFW